MQDKKAMKRFSAAGLAAHRARGESLTDPPRLRAKTEADIQRDIATDFDFKDVPEDWHLRAG